MCFGYTEHSKYFIGKLYFAKQLLTTAKRHILLQKNAGNVPTQDSNPQLSVNKPTALKRHRYLTIMKPLIIYIRINSHGVQL